MSKVVTLDTLIRDKARNDYYRQVDAAWVAFCKAANPFHGKGVYSEALNKRGREMVEALKIEHRGLVEQTAVEQFLKDYEELQGKVEDMTNGN